MKRTLAVALLGVACATSIGQSSGNLVENGRFEADISGALVLNGSTLARDNTHVHSGAWALKVTTANVKGSGFWLQPRGSLAPPFSALAYPVVGGQSYTLTAWVYAEAGAVGKPVNMGLGWYVGLTFVKPKVNTVTVLAPGWNAITATVTAPVTITYAGLDFETDGEQGPQGVFDFWVDDVVFEPTN